jgi:hypothetical protein
MEEIGQLHVLAVLLPGKQLTVPLDKKVDGAQRRSGILRVEKYLVPRPGIKPFLPGRPDVTRAAMMTELSPLFG